MEDRMSEPLKEKRVIISGGSRGLGGAIARMLALKGACVTVVARNSQDLLSLLDTLPGKGHRMLSADLQSSAGIQMLYDECARYGFPDVVVANLPFRPGVVKLADRRFEWNRTGVEASVSYLMPILAETLAHQSQNRFGRWIGIGSIISKMGGPGQLQYTASKNLLGSLIKTIAIENSYKNITANMVLPGLIDTAGLREEYSPQQFQRLESLNLLRRAAKVEEVAHAVAFLADPLASYVTGIELPVCGGYDLSWALNQDNRNDG